MKIVAAGVTAGFLSGLLGVGGGIVMVPMLVLLAGLGQHAAHATSLGAVVPIAVVGAAWFAIEDEVSLAAAVAMSLGALVGAPIGAAVMARVSEQRLRVGFGLLAALVGISMVVT